MEKLLVKLGIKKPTPKMYYRLKKLITYFKIVDIASERIVVEEQDDHYFQFKFYSKLGAVEITLEETFYFNSEPRYTIEYVTYAGNRLFTLDCNDEHVFVSPCMGYDFNVSAKEIDLAILELEEYLTNEFGDLETLLNGYLTAKRLAEKSHNEQIKILERP